MDGSAHIEGSKTVGLYGVPQRRFGRYARTQEKHGDLIVLGL